MNIVAVVMLGFLRQPNLHADRKGSNG